MEPRGHDDAWEALGAWVLGACAPQEAPRIAAHVAACGACRAEAAQLRIAADWFGAAQPLAPPPSLRRRVLAAAWAARAPARPTADRLLTAYADQAAGLAELLDGLTGPQWTAAVPRHGSVARLMTHLADNDHRMLAALEREASVTGPGGADPAAAAVSPGVAAERDASPTGPAAAGSVAAAGSEAGVQERAVGAAATGWHSQVGPIARWMDSADAAALEHAVPLAGRAGIRRPAREALVQRAFETWIHADDVRRAVRLPVRPPAGTDLRMIVDLGVGLLPVALAGLGRARPGRAVRLVLTGAGGGEWEVALGPAPQAAARVIAAVTADAVDFCRLMAGRHPPEDLAHSATGHAGAMADLLYAASMLGCD